VLELDTRSPDTVDRLLFRRYATFRVVEARHGEEEMKLSQRERDAAHQNAMYFRRVDRVQRTKLAKMLQLDSSADDVKPETSLSQDDLLDIAGFERLTVEQRLAEVK